MKRLTAVQLVRVGFHLPYGQWAVVDAAGRHEAEGVLVVEVGHRHHAENAYSCDRVCLACGRRNGRAAPVGEPCVLVEAHGRKETLSICLKVTETRGKSLKKPHRKWARNHISHTCTIQILGNFVA